METAKVERETVYKMRTFVQGLAWASIPTLAESLQSNNPDEWANALVQLKGLVEYLEETIFSRDDAARVLEEEGY